MDPMGINIYIYTHTFFVQDSFTVYGPSIFAMWSLRPQGVSHTPNLRSFAWNAKPKPPGPTGHCWDKKTLGSNENPRTPNKIMSTKKHPKDVFLLSYSVKLHRIYIYIEKNNTEISCGSPFVGSQWNLLEFFGLVDRSLDGVNPKPRDVRCPVVS